MTSSRQHISTDTTNIKSNRVYLFNYLKGIAILMVIFTHINFTPEMKLNPLFTHFVNMAVPIFTIITGFNFSSSYERNNCKHIFDFYNIKFIFKKFIRLTFPFLIILGLEYIFLENMTQHKFLTNFIDGGVGPGSYYFPIMLQFIAILPLVYLFIRKYKVKALVALFFITLLYDLCGTIADINRPVYRLLCFRYLFHASLGSYLFIRKKEISSNVLMVLLMIGLSAIEIYAHNINNFYMVYPFERWTKTSLLTAFYIFPIIAYLYQKFKYTTPAHANIVLKFLNIVGQASWHICLAQMFYFALLGAKIFSISFYVQIVLHLPICTTAGILFFYFEKFILKLLARVTARKK